MAMWAAGLGLLAILGVGYAARDRLLETYWCRFLDSEDTKDQQYAVRRLAALGSPVCLPHVLKALDAIDFVPPPEGEIPAWIREYFARVGIRGVPPLIGVWDEGDKEQRVTAGWALRLLGSPANESLSHLLSRLQSSDETTRTDAANTLEQLRCGGIGGLEVAKALTLALEDPEPSVRLAAVTALSCFDREVDVFLGALIRCLKDDNRSVRLVALDIVVDKVEPAVRSTVLREALDDSSRAVRLNALRMISSGFYGQTVIESALRAGEDLLTDPSPLARDLASRYLGDFGAQAKRALPALKRVASSDPDLGVRKEAATAVEQIESANAPPR